jgi:glycerol-3-phosphate acyltransferase PlsX
MAMSKFCLRTMANIERPAIAAIWPTLRGESIVLDVGATIGADAQQLVDFAVMGAAMARSLFGIERPTSACSMSASRRSRARKRSRKPGACCAKPTCLHEYYHGFVEGDDIGKGTVDVVVTEGFSGNIALKTAEGTARQIAELSARGDEPHADGQDRLSLRQGRLRPPA